MPVTTGGGFVVDRKVYRLIFDGDLDGLRVVVRSSSIAAYEEIAELARHQFSSPPTAEDMAIVGRTYAAFAAVLIEWNLEEPADRPVSADLAGVKTQEPGLIQALIVAWLEAVASALPSSQAREQTVADLELEHLLGDASQPLAS